MKQKIKTKTRITAGVILAATLLTIPVTTAVMAGERSAPSAHKTCKADPGDEDPYSSSLAVEDQLLILDDSTINRDLAQVPGLDSTESDKLLEGMTKNKPSGLKKESLDEYFKEKALEEERDHQAEAEAKRVAAEKKAKAKVQSQTSVTSPSGPESQSSQSSPSDKPQEETGATNDASAAGSYLLEISNPDSNYQGRSLQVSDRQTLEGLVMGEWGNDYIGAVLVAQCIRDSMVKEGTNSAAVIKRRYGYTAPIKRQVSQTVKDAVSFVFDQGGSGVQHPIYYFYASNLTRGTWHESQKFVVQRQAVRFFSPHR